MKTELLLYVFAMVSVRTFFWIGTIGVIGLFFYFLMRAKKATDPQAQKESSEIEKYARNAVTEALENLSVDVLKLEETNINNFDYVELTNFREEVGVVVERLIKMTDQSFCVLLPKELEVQKALESRVNVVANQVNQKISFVNRKKSISGNTVKTNIAPAS